MKDVIFREERLIDRESETEFFKEWFSKTPKEILWVYGPKSTGKTTLIEYIVEQELFEDFKLFKSKKYNVKYINFRGKLIGSYKTFLNSIINKRDKELEMEVGMGINLGVFRLSPKLYKRIKEKDEDMFDLLIEHLQESKKRNILIIDEIQVLEDLYIDKERELLKEFLNFCVRLTKELHLAHVVILSSNTIFIKRIYDDAKLKKTSKFYRIDHLNYEITKEWLEEENFHNNEIELIWEYLGGSIYDIQRMIRDKHEFDTLEEYLERQKWLAYTEIVNLLRKIYDIEFKTTFKTICREILDNKFYLLKDEEREKTNEVIEYFAEREILFYEPLDLKVTGNNRLYEKGMELLLK